MRILAIASWWPEPADNGIRLRISHLLRVLSRNHEIHLAALAQGPIDADQQARLARYCASAYAVPEQQRPLRQSDLLASLWQPEPASVRATWNPAFAALVEERAAAVQPDLVLAFELSAAPYARRITNVPRVLDDLEMARIYDEYALTQGRRRLRAWLTWHKHQSYVAHTLRDFDACTVVSAAEHRYVRALAPHRMAVLLAHNGADVAGSAGPWGDPEPDTLIYPGSLAFDANFDAINYFLREILPLIHDNRPSVCLRVTGKDAPERRAALPQIPGVEFTGFVPDVRALIARSWAEVVPLRVGSGTRLKILEALALGTPVITTAKGVEGLDLVHGKHVFVAETAADFAMTATLLLTQPALRARLAEAGRQVVRERYDWQSIGRRLDDLIGAIARQKGYRHAFRTA